MSNTNAIHYSAIGDYIIEKHKVVSLDKYFHKTYYSHLTGLRKPDIRIFQLVINDNNLVPEETLYLDDTGEHLKSASSLGIVTVKVTPENSILDILKDY